MKIFSITIVQNQEDIIGDCIEHHANIFDHLYIWEIGSEDSTKTILKKLSEKYNNITVFFKKRQFTNDLRAILFRYARKQFDNNDWCYQLDSDEFLITDIRKTIKKAEQWKCTNLRTYHYNFVFTDIDEKNNVTSYKDLKYYNVDYSEVRCFKNRTNLYWPIGHRSILPLGLILPLNVGRPYFEFLKVFHYSLRSIKQIKERMAQKKKIVSSSQFKEVDGINYNKYLIDDYRILIRKRKRYRRYLKLKPPTIKERYKIILVTLIKPLIKRLM